MADIGALSALMALPWALKFFWAPAVDLLCGPRWGLRSWIAAAQSLMAVTLLPLLVLDFKADLGAVTAVCLAHAFCAATQDVAVDALAVRAVPARERGRLTAWMQGGMMTGRSLFGGGALLMERWLGPHAVVGLMCAAVLSSLALLAWAGRDLAAPREPSERGADFVRSLREALGARSTWAGLGFALISGCSFEAAGAVAGPFLIDHGLSKGSVGGILSLPVAALMLAGAFVGGRLSDGMDRRRGAALALAGTATTSLLLAAADAAGLGIAPLLACWALLYAAIGAFTAASYALFMDLTEPRLGATQFSAFMGATNACESWSAAAGGRLIGAFGYPAAFAVMAGLSLVSLPMLRRSPK